MVHQGSLAFPLLRNSRRAQWCAAQSGSDRPLASHAGSSADQGWETQGSWLANSGWKYGALKLRPSLGILKGLFDPLVAHLPFGIHVFHCCWVDLLDGFLVFSEPSQIEFPDCRGVTPKTRRFGVVTTKQCHPELLAKYLSSETPNLEVLSGYYQLIL